MADHDQLRVHRGDDDALAEAFRFLEAIIAVEIEHERESGRLRLKRVISRFWIVASIRGRCAGRRPSVARRQGASTCAKR